MKRFLLVLLLLGIQFVDQTHAQPTLSKVESVDTAAIARIMALGTDSSRVMEILSYLSDVHGPRLTGSPGYDRAAKWARGKLAEFGLANAHLEGFGPFGRGWTLERMSAHVLVPQPFPIIAYPKAWSPGVGGTAELVHLEAKNDSTLDTYRGKLKGKIVLMGDIRELRAHFDPLATRETESSLLTLANADVAPQRQRRFEGGPGMRAQMMFEYKKMQLLQKEGVLAILSPSRGDGGNVFVQGASVIAHPDTPFFSRPRVQEAKEKDIIPQVVVAAEHFNRMIRMIQKGELLKMELNVAVRFNRADSLHNVIAEIPGTDLADEVVIIGAHLDSWHAGTGTTDNGTGVAVCMEAMRILTALDLKPRRTIRIGLWAGEEQGLLGSRAHVRKHFGERVGGNPMSGGGGELKLKPAAEKFSAYFNNDNGTGRVRGIYMQGNEALRPIFRKWFAPLGDPNSFVSSLSSTSSTDHMAFESIGLPGFQFIQDDIEYFTRTWHSSMDLYERAQEDDLKQAAIVMAAFAYNAAMRDERLPRKSN